MKRSGPLSPPTNGPLQHPVVNRQGDYTMTATPLLDRIKARREPIEAPKVVAIRPTWIKRMQEQGLPVKDQTAYVLGSYVPEGSGHGA